MREGQFSRTALGAAGHRSAHQILEGGRYFADPPARYAPGRPPARRGGGARLTRAATRLAPEL